MGGAAGGAQGGDAEGRRVVGGGPRAPDAAEIARAADVLRRGGLVAFPTETVYGLGAAARSPDAVRRIFAAKGRPADHPVIVHLPAPDHLARWASEVPDGARALAARFWPGPLTLILPRAKDVPDEVTGGQPTVGLRLPDHPVARALLEAFGDGVAAPSANRYGRISPTTAAHVREELGDRVDVILDGGPCAIGVESTIVDLSGERPALLRPGGVTREQLEEVLGVPVLERTAAAAGAVRAPGTLASHYAPRTPLLLVATDRLEEEARERAGRGQRLCILARRGCPRALPAVTRGAWRVLPGDPEGAARELYASLRALDAIGADAILVEEAPLGPAWLAVRDRLARAAHPARGGQPG